MSTEVWPRPEPVVLSDGEVELRPLDAARDAGELFAVSHGTPEREAVWKYLPRGPFADEAAMRDWLARDMSGADPLAFVAHQESRPVGMLAILAIAPEHGRAEIGHVWTSASVQRGGVNTQAQFLVLKYLLGELKYRRVEWKCNAENAASRYAAHRMGFVFEGRFRQHMVIKGRNRDTDWFSMTDKDWPRVKANFEAWIESGGARSLAELNHGV